MQSLLHLLNIGTLATWLSVAGFGTVGVVIHERHQENLVAESAETLLPDADFLLGESGTPEPEGASADMLPSEMTESVPEVLPAPPELPAVSEFSPLPEVPEIPLRPAARPAETRSERPSTQPGARSTASTPRSTTSAGKPGGGSPGPAATGMSDSSRLAAGRMPPPSYPSEARRNGQTGTVTVEFTVDASGRVISAYAKSASPWPLLNEEAVRTVRRWKFPPGGVMKLQRPIVFQLR